jgi:lambda repressor-like predicted transcriptional regulator
VLSDYLDVVTALRRAGWTMRRLSLEAGKAEEAMRMGLQRGTPWAIALAAKKLHLAPEEVTRAATTRPGRRAA